MIRAVLTMKVKEGREQDFERAWRNVAEHTRHIPGNLRQALLVDQSEPGVFVITSDWEDHESFHRFERSEIQDILTFSLRAMRESSRMSIQTLVTHVDHQSA
jgi:heme-degrading monooxygenase HmoA